MVQLAEDSLAEQRLADGIVDEESVVEEEGVEEEEVITPAKPEIVRGSSELLPPDVWEPPVQDPPTEDEEPKEAPVKPDEDARGIIGLWFEGNVRARAYRKMGRA